MGKLSVIAGKSSEELAKKIAKRLRGSLTSVQNVTFPDGETKVTLQGNLSNQKIIVVQSTNPPVDTNLIQLLALVAKAKETASNVVVVIPYMGYARQDKEFLPGEIVTMKMLAKLLGGIGASEIITVDIHSKVGLEYFKIKTRNVTAIPELVKYFKKMNLKDLLVVSPDRGGTERAAEFAKSLKVDYIALEKQRDRKTGKVQIMTKDVGDISKRDLILVDDMISTGGSIVKAAKFLKKQKCGRIFVACTHGLLVNNAEEKIQKAGVEEIVSTNTIPGKTSNVDVSAIIAKSI